jgi:predicted regulator of Ras-like GTPase activity (Roadblock/LC7/MglB family)
MTPLTWSWLLSLTGAVLFFAAGAAYTARRFGRVAFADSQLAAAGALASVPAPARMPSPALEALENALGEAETRRAALERELAQRTAERQQLFRELEIERSARLQRENQQQLVLDPSSDADLDSAGVRQELAVIREQLTTRERQIDALRDENVKLRALDEDLSHTKRELAVLNEQHRVLRAQAFIAKPPAPPRPRTPTPTLSATGRALQTIVDTETRLGRAKSAVIADELGLLVAASSATNEYNDALAALGAYLADVGSRTRDILPLRKLRHVVVCDDHDVTLTVRPLAMDDPGLALVTLAVEPTSSANDNRHN